MSFNNKISRFKEINVYTRIVKIYFFKTVNLLNTWHVWNVGLIGFMIRLQHLRCLHSYRGSQYRPQAEFFYIHGWLIKIYGCFSAKAENWGEGIFRLKISTVYQIYSWFPAKPEKNCNIKFK